MRRWTPRIAAAQTRLQIKALRSFAKERMGRVGYLWMDNNSYLETQPDEILAQLDCLLDDLEEQVAEVLRESNESGTES